MNEELMDDLMLLEDDYESDFYDDIEAQEDIDDIFEFIMDDMEEDFDEDFDDDDEDEDYDERRRRRRRSRYRRRPRKSTRSRKKSSGSIAALKKEIALQKRKNAQQDRRIKGNYRMARRAGSVNRIQNGRLKKLDTQQKLDGALDFAGSINTDENGVASLDYTRLLQGAVKSGLIGNKKGMMSNPFVVGGLGFLLDKTNILENILPSRSEES